MFKEMIKINSTGTVYIYCVCVCVCLRRVSVYYSNYREKLRRYYLCEEYIHEYFRITYLILKMCFIPFW